MWKLSPAAANWAYVAHSDWSLSYILLNYLYLPISITAQQSLLIYHMILTLDLTNFTLDPTFYYKISSKN